ncbi:MmcB family DNA repair protein [Pacificispira spongiicola]|uniref:MmcB family DNA repair protein n=1 Tax=Pacificispira spongiicola TaxID=2729598 RepID=UPI0029CA110A|nr:MmcB family DNA repair protein [Pacificispira spongiicola]
MSDADTDIPPTVFSPTAARFDTRPDATLAVTRGTLRLMRDMGLGCITEMPLNNGRRVDIIGFDKKGVATIVEVKSSLEDFTADSKWEEYLPYCDRFFFAVPMDFPVEVLPGSVGLILADAYGAAVERPAAEGTMNGSRRKALTLKFARLAAERLLRLAETV